MSDLELKIIRSETGDQGTFGLLVLPDGTEFHTGELPWLDNHAETSCIPAGDYRCEWTLSNRLKRETYQVLNVPNRTGIRIHPANFMGDAAKGYRVEVLGCIALGLSRGTLSGQAAMIGSRSALFQFEERLARQPFNLKIVDAFKDVPTS